MDLKNRSVKDSEASDCANDPVDESYPHYRFSENDDFLEDEASHFLFIDSTTGGFSSSLTGSQHIHALEHTLGLIDSILQPTNFETMSVNRCYLSTEGPESLSVEEKRPKSFLHDEMHEFNQIFSELVSTPQRKFPCRDPSLFYGETQSSALPKELFGKPSDFASASKSVRNEGSACGLLRVKSAPLGFISREPEGNLLANSGKTCDLPEGDETVFDDPGFATQTDSNNHDSHTSCSLSGQSGETGEEIHLPRRHSEGNCGVSEIVHDAESTLTDEQKLCEPMTDEQKLGEPMTDEQKLCEPMTDEQKLYEPMNEEDADSGYQTGDSSVPAMVSAAKKLEGVASLCRDDLLRRIEKFNSNKLGLAISLLPDSNIYEGSVRVHLNIYRPIKMNLCSRPSSIYDILIRTDARLPEKESNVAFFRLPSNTFKAIHISSETTTNAVIKTLLTKFNITDHPKRFALYERILPNDDVKKPFEVDTPLLNNTLSFVRRLADDDHPLELCLRWADHGLDLLDRCQFVLQENDPGEIMWDDFSLPELSNFLCILSKEERCYADQIRTKYRLLKREIEKKLQNFKNDLKTS